MKHSIAPWKTGLVSGIFGGVIVVLIAGIPALGFQDQSSIESTNVTVSAIDVSDIVEQVNPAVVSIIVKEDVPIVEQYFENPFGNIPGSPFSFQIPRYRQNGTEEREVGGGSGFVVSSDGYIVTNAHVVTSDDARYTVFFTDERSFDAEVIARDEMIDIAVLKIDASDLPYLEFGTSDDLKLGEAVIAIGNALAEYRNTVSTGVVSGLARSITASNSTGQSEALDNVIQTDAAINPGNSGGPLINLEGKVIGVNVAVAMGSENIGFSLPSDVVRTSVEEIMATGKIARPYLGVRYVLVTSSLQEKNNLDVDYGALVLRGEQVDELAVLPGSPADKAGIEEYDILLEIDGQKIDEEHSLASLIREKRVGETIEVRLFHDGEEKTVTIELEEQN